MTCPVCHQPWAASQSIEDHETCSWRAHRRATQAGEGGVGRIAQLAADALVVSFAGLTIYRYARMIEEMRDDEDRTKLNYDLYDIGISIG